MVSEAMIQQIVKTLPIGLYVKRRIPLDICNDETSYYVPAEDKIYISVPIIQRGLEHAVLSADYSAETACRSMVYHEVSHAILTPTFDSWCYKWDDIMNVFEDERIETLLKDFYLNVDFKKNCLYINGGKIEAPTSAESAFYQLVRFRICSDASFIKRVEELIQKYSHLTANDTAQYRGWSQNRTCHVQDVRDYHTEVHKLYEDFCSAFPSLPKSPQNDFQNLMDNIKQGKGVPSTGKGEGNGQSESTGNTPTENGTESASSQEEGEPGGRMGGLASNVFDTVVGRFHNDALTKELEMSISNFNKKNKGGSGTCGYSGIFNPRNVTRNDYRYFDRKLSVNGNNAFGTCHLNLWIDCSGSFCNNEDSVNTLLTSLADIEKRNSNFTFDLILCGNGVQVTDRKKRWLKTGGGNCLVIDDVKKVYQDMQKRNTVNYNIILFDGDCGACGACGLSSRKHTSKNALRVFDNNNCFLIMEEDNKQYLNVIKTAKYEIVNSGYPAKLQELIVKVLGIAFR